MAGLMESFAAGSEAVTRADVAITDRQRSELQRQYMPEKFQQEAIQQRQATEIQSLNLQKLQETVQGEAALRPALQQYYSNPKNQQKPLSEQNKDLSILASNAGDFKTAIKLKEDSVKAAKEETDASTAKLKTQDALLEHGQNIINNIDPTDDNSWNQRLLELDASGGNSNRIKADAAQFGREKAIELASERAKTFRQRQEERKAEDAKRTAENGAKRIEVEQNKVEAILAASMARIRDKEVSESAKEKKIAVGLTANLNKEIGTLHEKYVKARSSETNDDKKIELDANYKEELAGVGERYATLFTTAGLEPLVISERKTAPLGASKSVIKAPVKATGSRVIPGSSKETAIEVKSEQEASMTLPKGTWILLNGRRGVVQ